LSQATDTFGALLFRDFNLGTELDTYEHVMEGCGLEPGTFVGTAPRAKVGKYVVRNVSFEAVEEEEAEEEKGGGEVAKGSGETMAGSGSDGGPSALDQFRQSAGVVWAENNEQFFNFHNELAYMDQPHHEELGYAKYAFFCCTIAPEVGGYTILADTRKALAKLRTLVDDLPVAFKFVIARKSLAGTVAKQSTGDYEGFLTGGWEFEQYPDQWSHGALPSLAASVP
jgi:hypothetical protein